MKGFFTFFKYEFLSSAMPLAFTYGIGILALLLLEFCEISFSRKWFFYELFLANDVMKVLLITLMVGSFIAFGALLIVRAFQSFWVEIFGSRGYLTLTLPLSLDAILLSKIIVLAFWAVFGIYFAPVSMKILYDPESFVRLLSVIYTQEVLIIFFHTLTNTLTIVIFYITLILFITALLNALKVRTFVLFKGFGIALVIHLIWIPFAILTPFSFLNIDKLFLSIIFYFAARYLIMYKLELE